MSNSFSTTFSNLWNCLPRSINSISNVPINTFKAQLDKFLDLIPDDPRPSASGDHTDVITGRLSNSIWHMTQIPSIKTKIAKFEKDWWLACANRGGPREVIPHPRVKNH